MKVSNKMIHVKELARRADIPYRSAWDCIAHMSAKRLDAEERQRVLHIVEEMKGESSHFFEVLLTNLKQVDNE